MNETKARTAHEPRRTRDPETARARPELTTEAGARARLGEDDTLQVFSPEGDLVFEYDASTRTTRLRIPAGDLELDVPDGAVRVRSGKGIALDSDGPTRIGGARVDLGSAEGSARLGIGRDRVDVVTPTLRMTAQRTEAQLQHATIRGEELTTTWERIRLAVDRLDAWTEQVRARATDIHQTVERTWRLTSGRFVAVGRDAFRLTGGKFFLRVEKDVKIDGESIDLG